MVVGLPAKVLVAIKAAQVVGVLRADSSQSAIEASLAAVAGGLRVVELTFTTPNLTEAIEHLKNVLPNDVLLGAGTVLNLQQARAAVLAGATFLVSPHLSESILAFAQSEHILYIPGVVTPTEMMRATELGATALKLFPAESSGGVAYLKDILAPLPHLQIMVTGGIQPSQTKAYLEAGAVAVGLGSYFFPKAAIATQDWEAVQAATQAALVQCGVDYA
jgi:2-dehydro-3-deoxyphosphogluconate aldolase / (4S)-4-hydroxy-2-oxoglutarate aldolase